MGFNFGSKKNVESTPQADGSNVSSNSIAAIRQGGPQIDATNGGGEGTNSPTVSESHDKPATPVRGFTLPSRSAATGTPSQSTVPAAGTTSALPGSTSNGQEAAKAAAESLRAALSANPTPQMPAPVTQTKAELEAKAAVEALGAMQFQHPTQSNVVAAATQEQFEINIKRLYETFPNKDLIAPAIKRVLIDLQAHPEFDSFLAPEDIGQMVKLLRANYGIVKAAAVEKKEKTKKSRQKKADAAAVDLSDLGALLNTAI